MRKRWVALFLGMLLASAVTAAAFISASYEDIIGQPGKIFKTSQSGSSQPNAE